MAGPPPLPLKQDAAAPRVSTRVSRKLLANEAALRADERVRKVENGRLQCNLCGKWLKVPNFRGHLQNKCRRRGAGAQEDDDDSGGAEEEAPEWMDEALSELTEVESAGAGSGAESEWVRSPTPPPARALSPQPDYAARYAMYLNPDAGRAAAPGQFSLALLPADLRFSSARFAEPPVSDTDSSAGGPLTPADAGAVGDPSLVLADEMSTRLFLTRPAPRPCTHRADEDADSKPLEYIAQAGLVVPPPPPPRPRPQL